jgi:uncharacterized membrane protein
MYAPANEYVPQCAPPETARGARLVWGALATLSLVILALVFAAPLLLAHGYVQPSSFIYRAFSFLCHQIPERSFHLEGHALGVCARCTGIYAGFAASVLFYPVVRSLGRADSPSRLWLLLACVPIAVDFALGYFGVWENTHFSRFATGAIFGAACALFVVPGFLDLGRIMQKSNGA